MALPGTELANTVLKQTGLMYLLRRNYTQKRVNDRSYKIYGNFSDSEAEKIISALNDAGARNARKVPYFMGYTGASGVRFELAD